MELAFCWRRTTPRGRRVDIHAHDALEIVYYESGVGTSFVDGRRYTVRPGSITIIPPGVAHDKSNDTEITAICLGLRGSGLEGLPGFVRDPAGIVGDRCSRLLDELVARRYGYERISQGLAFEVVGHIERLTWLRGNPASGPALVARAVDVIRERDGDLTVRELAEALHVSKDYLRRLFQEHANEPALQRILRARIDRARHLLGDPHLTCAEVAFRCGFQGVEHFSRLFRRLTGLTPSRYREQCLSDPLSGRID